MVLRPAPSADIPNWSAIISTIQPISTSHSRCHNSQITLATAAQKWKAVTDKDELVGRREIGAVGHGEHALCRPASNLSAAK